MSTWREHLTFLFLNLCKGISLGDVKFIQLTKSFGKKIENGSCVLKSSLKATNLLNKIFMYYFNEKYLFNRLTLHVHIKMEQQEKFSTWVTFKQTGFPPFFALSGRREKYPQQLTYIVF